MEILLGIILGSIRAFENWFVFKRQNALHISYENPDYQLWNRYWKTSWVVLVVYFLICIRWFPVSDIKGLAVIVCFAGVTFEPILNLLRGHKWNYVTVDSTSSVGDNISRSVFKAKAENMEAIIKLLILITGLALYFSEVLLHLIYLAWHFIKHLW